MSAAVAPASGAELLERGQAVLAERLPSGWDLRLVRGRRSAGESPDAIVEVVSPDGVTSPLLIEVKQSVDSRDVRSICDQLARYLSDRPGSTGVVVARYLSPQVRQRLSAAGLSYLDATGNVRLTLSRPGLFVSDHGSDRDPWRGPGRPRGSIKGSPAAKVVRALVDFDREWRMRQLVETANVSTGAAYRVVQLLQDEELAVKEGTRIRVPHWERLLRRWSRDYEFTGANRTTRWLAPRGLDRLLERASTSEVEYAVTGTIAAAEWAAYAPARLAMIYTAAPLSAAEAFGLRPAEAGANVLLAEPASEVVFTRTQPAAKGGYEVAAVAQVAVDLLTGPGRNPAEAEELIGWMTRNESSWRRK